MSAIDYIAIDPELHWEVHVAIAKLLGLDLLLAEVRISGVGEARCLMNSDEVSSSGRRVSLASSLNQQIRTVAST